MPSVRDNATYFCRSFMDRHGAAVLHFAKVAAVLIACALALEVFVFNMNFYLTAGLEPRDVTRECGLPENDIGQLMLTEANHAVVLQGLDQAVENVWLDFDGEQPAQLLECKVSFTDEAHKTFFDTTEYTRGVPIVDVSTVSEKSEYLNLNASGRVQALEIELVGDEVRYPVLLDKVVVNANRPFDFNKTRFGVALGILCLAYAFRPRSAIYRWPLRVRPRLTKAIIIGVFVVECLVMTSYLFFGSNLVGVATSSYNYGSWDGVSVANTFEVGGENAQQYAELAKSFTRGQLCLEEEPPEWLKAMDDPYDKGARDEAQKETGEDYLFDVAYHDGKYYVYFGVVPVFLFYLPFYLVTGANFPTALGVLASVLAFAGGCTALLDRFARHHFKRVSLGLFLLLQIPLVACSGVLYLLKFPTFYSLPIALGLAFSVWGLYLWMVGRSAAHPCRWYAAGSLCMALVAGCRPQLLVLSCVAFPLFWRRYITEKRLFTGAGAREFACLVAPYAAVALAIMGYNAARFGSPTDFGASYNLTVNDMTRRGFNLGRILPALFAYFLQPPCVTGVFPYVQPAPFDTTYLGQTIKEATFGGIFACLPVLWILAASRRILALRVSERATHTTAGVVVALVAGGVVVALADAQMAGILERYFADFSFMFLAAAVLLLFVANERLAPGTPAASLFQNALLAVVALSVVYVALVCFAPEVGWYSDIYDWAYQNVIEAAQFWT